MLIHRNPVACMCVASAVLAAGGSVSEGERFLAVASMKIHDCYLCLNCEQTMLNLASTGRLLFNCTNSRMYRVPACLTVPPPAPARATILIRWSVKRHMELLSPSRSCSDLDQLDQVLFCGLFAGDGGSGLIRLTDEPISCSHTCWPEPHLCLCVRVLWEQWPCCLPISHCCWSCLTPVLGRPPSTPPPPTHTLPQSTHTPPPPSPPPHTPIHLSSHFTSCFSFYGRSTKTNAYSAGLLPGSCTCGPRRLASAFHIKSENRRYERRFYSTVPDSPVP